MVDTKKKLIYKLASSSGKPSKGPDVGKVRVTYVYEKSKTEPTAPTLVAGVCGPKVRVIYVWRGDQLTYSEISRTDGHCLSGFPDKGHFLIKVKKALVKTSEDAKVYKAENRCTLRILKRHGSLSITKLDMDTVRMNCELPKAEKIKQIEEGQTLPVLAEKLKTHTIFTQLFQPKTSIICEYEPHDPELLDKHLIEMRPEYDDWYSTANKINISPAFVLFYGHKYRYKIDMHTEYRRNLKPIPQKAIIFYGHIYDTTNTKLTGYDTSYFQALTPRTHEEEKEGPPEYISDIDDYDDDTDDEEPYREEVGMQPVILLPKKISRCVLC